MVGRNERGISYGLIPRPDGLQCHGLEWAIVVALLAVMLRFPFCGTAQELDAVVTKQSRSPTRIADEIADPAERKAYLEFFKKHSPAETAALAEVFLAKYPTSWELSQIYAIAARALINLNRYSEALDYARRSLALYPEDPLLLVPIANVQAQMQDTSGAEQSAEEALIDLDRFTRPASVSERDWPALRRNLKASAYFALARAKTDEALGSRDLSQRSKLLHEAHSNLVQAQEFNPKDAEIVYLLALVDLALGKPREAALGFAKAAREGSPLRLKAMDHLEKLYSTSLQKSSFSFQDYLKGLHAQAQAEARASRPQNQPSSVPLPGYAGSQACRYCHANIYEAWTHTGMARMLRPYRPENVIGDFTVHNTFYGGDRVLLENGTLQVIPGKNRWLFARMFIRHGRHYFATRDFDGHWRTYPVDYTIGSKWEQGYATRLPDGEIQVFPIQYNVRLRSWVDFWQFIDPPGSPRADLHQWGKMGVWTNYQVNCAVCHTSQLRNPAGKDFAPQGLVFREPGIDCEMCHGPCARHVAAMMKGQPYPKGPLDPPVDFDKINAGDFLAICSQCHMQSAVREPGPHGELNYSTQGEFFERYQSRPYDEFSHLGFYKDGRFRQTTFIVEALMRSKCYRKGRVTCGNCHEVHGSNAPANPTSLKFPKESNLMCTQCHAALKDRVALVRHTHHAVGSEGSRCVSCHMPRIMNALLFEARTHRIDDIPNADNTLRFGQQESPNACLLCHQDRDAQWVKQQLMAWNLLVGGKALR